MRYLSKADFEWPVALCLFVSCNTCYYYIIPRAILLAGELGSFSLLLWTSLFYGKNNISAPKLYIYSLLYILGALPIAYGASIEPLGFALRFLFVLPCLVIYFSSVNSTSVFSLFYKVSDICYFFASISLFFWLLGETLGIIPPLNHVAIAWGGVSYIPNYYFLHFGCQHYRNCSVFAEGPVFVAMLTVCLGVELFLREKCDKKKIGVFVVSMLSTVTTTGQLILMGMLFTRFFVLSDRKISMKMKFVVYLFFMVTFLVVVFIGGRVLAAKVDGLSFMVRLKFILEEIDAWLSSPIFGCGYYSHIDGSSNSFFLLLAEGGLYQSFFYLFSLVILPYVISKKTKIKGIFYYSLFFYLMLCITVVPYCYITMAMMALSLSYCLKKSNKFYLA